MLAKFSHYMEYNICHADDNTSILSYSKCMFYCSTYMLVYAAHITNSFLVQNCCFGYDVDAKSTRTLSLSILFRM